MKPIFRNVLSAGLFLVLTGPLCTGLPRVETDKVFAAETLPSGAPDWPSVLKNHGDRLAAVDSDQSAKEAFVSVVGPALQLSDAAGAIAAKGLPAKLAKELFLPDVARAAQRLVSALSAWRLADSLTYSLSGAGPDSASSSVASSAQLDWLQANGPFPSLLVALPASAQGETQAGPIESGDRTGRAIAAGRASMEASQQALTEWLRLKSWKDRVRGLRGQARLCGTWQWVIHNHKDHHQEQKLSLLFPPPGSEGKSIPGLSEIIVLGDTVYLRWENAGHTQEDSLLFSKEGARLEGTFVNSQGGWGSISGKRTATCTP